MRCFQVAKWLSSLSSLSYLVHSSVFVTLPSIVFESWEEWNSPGWLYRVWMMQLHQATCFHAEKKLTKTICYPVMYLQLLSHACIERVGDGGCYSFSLFIHVRNESRHKNVVFQKCSFDSWGAIWLMAKAMLCNVCLHESRKERKFSLYWKFWKKHSH
jgi:hypothetical protein